MAYTVLAVSMAHINAKTTPINDTDYNCCIKAVELVYPIIWVHVMPLVINSLGDRHTYDVMDKSYFKKAGTP